MNAVIPTTTAAADTVSWVARFGGFFIRRFLLSRKAQRDRGSVATLSVTRISYRTSENSFTPPQHTDGLHDEVLA